ncbi:hypothetical protein Ancab_018656 [Ancistrocladus abbreviatus]
MSTSYSDQTTFSGGASPVKSLDESLLEALSEITTSAVCLKTEQNNFLDIGSYLYRASVATIELQATENTSTYAVEILQSLYNSIHLAKDTFARIQQSRERTSEQELSSIVKQMEGIINHIGEDLSSIAPLSFGDQKFAEIAVLSLSREMKNAQFEVRQTNEACSNKQLQRPLPPDEQLEMASITMESDLYSISTEVSTENSHLSDITQIVEVLRGTSKSSQSSARNVSAKSLGSFLEATHYTEPLYKSFFCPLTKEIMDDPVTVQSGATYERKAITKWFEEFGDSEQVICPATGQKLVSRTLSPNIALKAAIVEWKDRKETARIKLISKALSLANTGSMVLDALDELKEICQKRPDKIIEVRNIGLTPLLANLLEVKARQVRCAALEVLRYLAEDGDEGKESIGKTTAITTTVRMLSSSHQPIRHSALLLLIELSNSQTLSERIGWVTGGILLLIRTKYNRSADTFASEAADQILRNLSQCPNNIKCMAENGYLEPLLDNLVKGCEETKLEMAHYLGEIVLGHDDKTYVAERASTALIQMVCTGNTSTRKAAFKALTQVSSHQQTAKILVEGGIIKIMVEEMFTRKIGNEPMTSLKEASAILANILESGLELENIEVNTQGHKMASDYIVFNIIYMIKHSNPDDLNLNLIRVLSYLIKTPKSANSIVSAIKESDASYTLVELIDSPNEELGIAAIKLLITLSPNTGHTLVDRLCQTKGQPEGLMQSPTDMTQITERKAVSAKFLANLPHQNLTLNLALLRTVPGILQAINYIQRNGTRSSRYVGDYLEGLVGILVRFTTTLFEPQVLLLAINQNFTKVFTDLLMETSSDEIKKLAAIGLQKLSSQSINLSKQPTTTRKKFNLFCLRKSSRKSKAQVCPVHRGVCSSQSTFCLIEVRAVEGLLACLDHQNVAVVEAALSALCTLLDDKVALENSVKLLNELNATQQVMKVVRDHKNESLQQKAFWMIERFLINGGHRSVSAVTQDRLFAANLVTAFHHGDTYTRQMAEKILRYLNQVPTLSSFVM